MMNTKQMVVLGLVAGLGVGCGGWVVGGEQSESATGTGSESGGAEAESSSESGGSTVGDGDGDPNVDLCGNGVVGPGEECEPDEADDYTCHPQECRWLTSCLDILETFDPERDGLVPSGDYEIHPNGDDNGWETECDMDRDGGGWTAIRLEDVCADQERLANVVESLPGLNADIEERMPGCQIRTRHDGEGFDEHGYVWDIEFPPTYSEFYLRGYEIHAYAEEGETSEIGDFVQKVWDQPFQKGWGDVSFGTGTVPTVVTSFANEGRNVQCESCAHGFTQEGQSKVFALEIMTSNFRIGWGERGSQDEGWYPWWDGVIFVR